MSGNQKSRQLGGLTVGAIASFGLVLGVGLPAGADSIGGVGLSNPTAGGNGDPGATAGPAGQSHGPSNPGRGPDGNPGSSTSADKGNPASHGGNGASVSQPEAASGGGDSAVVKTDVPRPEPTSAVSAPSVSGSSAGSPNQDCGEYCASPGDPSRNGNGGGSAGGRPEAGTVGKADGKNPPGQFRNGGDPNNGYECDGNHGIARGNPAHTRNCPPVPPPRNRPPLPPPPRGPPVTTVVTTVSNPPATSATPALNVLGLTLERPSTAPAPTAARVLGVTIERGATGTNGVTGALATTGVNTIDMGVLGMGLILGGAALSRLNRRRSQEGS